MWYRIKVSKSICNAFQNFLSTQLVQLLLKGGLNMRLEIENLLSEILMMK